MTDLPQVGVVPDAGLFYLSIRNLWMLVLDEGDVRFGDVLAFISPEGVAYEARVKTLGTLNGCPRRLEIGLDGTGEYLHEVGAGWPIYVSSRRGT